MTPVIIFLACLAVSLPLLGIAAVSRHKKKRRLVLPSIGAQAITTSRLNPQGSVLIGGEVWRASCEQRRSVDPDVVVQVIGIRDHLLLVDLCNGRATSM